jgi:hypothetical protein
MKFICKCGGQPTRCPPAWRLGEELTAAFYEMLHRVSGGSCEHGNEPLGSIKAGNS